MAITPGTVSVDNNGNWTTGAHPSGRYFALLIAQQNAIIAAQPIDPPLPTPFFYDGANDEAEDGTKLGQPKAMQALAAIANFHGSWIAGEFDLLRAAVGTSLSGLQRMPATPDENTDTKAPSAKKLLPLEYT